MGRLDLVGATEGGDGTRHTGDAHSPTPRERQPVDCAREKLRRRLGPARECDLQPLTTGLDTLSNTSRLLPGGAASSVARGRGIATARSKRSSSARESFSRYAASRCGVHAHSTAGSPRAPQGHMFIVPTSWKLAGKSACPPTRAMATTPSSSGWRSASRTERGELRQLVEQEDTSVRERDLAGAWAGPPPPTTAGADAPWWGARNGGTTISGRSGGSSPQTEWILVTLERLLSFEWRQDSR